MKRLIADVLGDDPTQNHIDIFNDAVGEDYPWLQTGTLQPYMEGLDPSPSGNPVVYRDGHGIDYSGEQNIACALNFYNDHIGALLGDEEADPLNCDCHGSVECGKDGSSCSASLDSEDPDHLIDELRIRDEVPEDQGAVLEKRGNPRKFRYTFKDAMGNVHKGTIESYSVSDIRSVCDTHADDGIVN